MKKISLLLLALLSLGLPACRGGKSGGLKIGLSFDGLREERWQHDRDFFVAKAKTLGAEVLVQSADSKDALQVAQCENLLTQGIAVLVVIPHNGKAAAQIVESAHRAKVPVLAYDRIINDCDLDYYVSFDNVRVGAMQAQALLDRVPKGNYVLIGGAPTDYNAQLFRRGQMQVLEPAVKAGRVRIVADQWANDWLPVEALKIMENALTRNGNKVDAVIASNDGTAGGAIQALEAQKLAGKVAISGQDADLAACQRVAKGTQTMTVYKPIKLLAEQAAELAVQLGRGQKPVSSDGVDNGKLKVPSTLLAPVAVDAKNLESTVVADGFHSRQEVFGR